MLVVSNTLILLGHEHDKLIWQTNLLLDNFKAWFGHDPPKQFQKAANMDKNVNIFMS